MHRTDDGVLHLSAPVHVKEAKRELDVDGVSVNSATHDAVPFAALDPYDAPAADKAGTRTAVSVLKRPACAAELETAAVSGNKVMKAMTATNAAKRDAVKAEKAKPVKKDKHLGNTPLHVSAGMPNCFATW